MIYFNELKANSRSLYDTFKKVLDYNTAMTTAITTVCAPFSFEDVLLPGKAFSSMDELREYIRRELDEEVNVIVEEGPHHSLTDREGHIDWYMAKKANDEIHFRFWNRYKKYLTHIKGWAETSVHEINSTTDEMLEFIENPAVPNRPFDRRGLVVGYVQSGKTANFMGIINKSIDCGYRIIVILAGMQESLRQQTQERIDEEVIGRDTSHKAEVKKIGVATLPGESYIPIDYLTESNFDPKKTGDFNIRKSHGTPPTKDRPIIFIVKKNKGILNNLIKYFRDWIETFDDDLAYKNDGIKQFNNLPLLVIDDEADQASVNTKPPFGSEGDELDPNAINYCIRNMLNLFRQKVYIGYTATPFANIFIRHDTCHSILGKDLFPFAFIKTLGTPSNYMGPKEVFGLNNDNDNSLPIYKEVPDAGQPLSSSGNNTSNFMYLRHKPDYVPLELPTTLKQALRAFVISSAIRWQRGQENKHNTMLIHCTRFNSVQTYLGNLVNEEMTILRNNILAKDEDELNEMKELFDTDYKSISKKMNKPDISWNDISPLLSKAVRKIEPKCRLINGTVGDLLDYKNKSKTGLWSIAIGGDKLSRGLTLDGLTISYFTRSATLYDTLMQMGRWFGYRKGYEDLCRIYTTQELFKWYRDVATAFESLRQEFIEMERLKLTPKVFGLRVEDHPDLMVTNVMKMRATDTMRLNYQGTLTETSTLPSSDKIIKSNCKATEEFILSLGKPSEYFNPKFIWENIHVNQIQEYFKNYLTYKGLPAANTIRINKYIDLQRTKAKPEYLEWNVSLITLEKKSNSKIMTFAGHDIVLNSRSVKEFRPDNLFIKRIFDPSDELSDFNENELDVVIANKSTYKEARSLNPRKKRPLLMIYVLNLTNKATKEDIKFEKPPVALAISWSASDTAQPINYVINSVYAELEMSEND